MKGIDAVARILKREGVQYLSCFPNSQLIDAATNAGIRPIMARTERVAVNIADGYARVSNGCCGMACTVQQSAGIENAFAGVAQAYSDSVPILILPGGEDRGKSATPPGFEAPPNYRGVTKWAAQVNYANRVPQFMRRAFSQLRMGKPGPVVLEIPGDVGEEEVNEALIDDYVPVRPVRSMADAQAVDEVAAAILEAEVPLIHAGQGALYAQATAELVELAELIQAPVMTTLTGKSAFPENHPLALGVGANTITAAVAHYLEQADLVLGVGSGFTPSLLAASIPPGKTMIQVTVDERDVNKCYSLDQILIGDAQLVLRQLIGAIRERLDGGSEVDRPSLVEEITAIKAQWLADWMPRLTSDQVPINPYRVIWDLMQTVDLDQTIVTHDSGHPRDQMVPFWTTTQPRGYLGWGHSTQLGTSLGLAMGAKLATPEKLVVNVMGDGAFGMVGMDFETAVRSQIPILTIMLNNSVLCGYEKYMPAATEKHLLKNLSGDYAGVATALGGFSQKVERPEEVIPAIQRAMSAVAAGQPSFIEVITCEDTNLSKGG